MPDASTLDTAQTSTPDTAEGTLLATIQSAGSSGTEIAGGFSLVEAIPNAVSAHRAASGADTGTDMSSSGFGGSTEKILNRGALVIWVEFATAGASCLVTPVFYDDSGTPAPFALGPQLSFTASAKRVTAAGNYMSEAQIVETFGFRRFKVYKDTVSAGNVTIYAIPL